MVVASAFSAPLSFSFASCHRTSSLHVFSLRNPSSKSTVSALQSPYGDSLTTGLSSRTCGSPLKLDVKDFGDTSTSYGAIEARKGNPPILPAVMTPGGPLDLSSVLFRNRIIFIGQPVNSLVAQRVISQLVTLATVDENADILVYLNCPGGSTYSVLAIYDCMSWIKPKVGTVCFGVAANQGALLLAGGEKGMRYAMPNARIMIHQPQSGCGGHVEDVRRQVNEAVQTRHMYLMLKVDNMYVAFTGQSLEKVQQYTERDRFLSVSEEEKCLVPFSQLFRASFELEGKEKGEQEIIAEKGENRRKVWQWNLGLLMACWKQNIEFKVLPFHVCCKIDKVGCIYKL